jgi:hypothetical protein
MVFQFKIDPLYHEGIANCKHENAVAFGLFDVKKHYIAVVNMFFDHAVARHIDRFYIFRLMGGNKSLRDRQVFQFGEVGYVAALACGGFLTV